MELQQHTNLKSVNIKQFIQCNKKNAVYIKGVNPCSNMGGDNIGEKYTSRLRDVLRGASRRAFLEGFGGMTPPPRNFF